MATFVLCFFKFALTSSSHAAGNSLPGKRATQAWQKSVNTPLVIDVIFDNSSQCECSYQKNEYVVGKTI